MLLSWGSLFLRVSDLRCFPPVDILETDDSIILMFDLPGIDTKEVIIKFCDNQIFIWGIKKHDKPGQKYICMERESGSFFRAISIPIPVDPEGAEAVYSDGVLRIRLPKAREKIFKIKVTKE